MQWSKMVRCDLLDGPSDGVILEIVPTMKTITHKGEKYHRMDCVTTPLDDGKVGACYLWEGYGRKLRERIKAQEADRA